MKNKIITLVGGTGFLGRYVVKLLAARGCQIRVIARDAEQALHLKTAGDVGQITLVSADISKPESLKGKLDNSFAVINLAGILYQKAILAGTETFEAVQARGPEALARLAKQAGAERFIQISAIGADSNSPSHYASTKAAGEQAVKTVFPEATILRPSIIFGTEDQFFNKFATMATVAPVLPLIGGKTRFQPVYVLDVAQAIVNALEGDSAKGQTFELGGPGIYSFREILEFICKTTNRHPLLLTLPFGIAKAISVITQMLPNPPLTLDQVLLLGHDNVVGAGAKTLGDLGIKAQSVENTVPLYLERFARKLA